MPDRFRVLNPSVKPQEHLPQFITWAAAEELRKGAERNHSQTLERLNERGGLSPVEMYFALRMERYKHPTFAQKRAAYLWVWAQAAE